jgi:hypothetical protein
VQEFDFERDIWILPDWNTYGRWSGNQHCGCGLYVFDGVGGITAYQNASTSGVFVANNQTTGFYHVYKNCVFTLSNAPYVAASDVDIDLTMVMTVGVIVDEGKELYALSTQAERAVLFIAKKM